MVRVIGCVPEHQAGKVRLNEIGLQRRAPGPGPGVARAVTIGGFFESCFPMLVALWAILATAVLAGAGYSHYKYRANYDLYYAQLFSQDERERAGAIRPTFSPYTKPLTALALLCVLVPVSLAI